MAHYWIRCTWVNQWDYRATIVEFIKTWCIVALSTFRIFLIVQATLNTFRVFFYTKESQSFVKPSSSKSRALKFSTKSIINAVLSTSLLFFFTLCHYSRPPLSLPLHTHMQTHSRIPWFDQTKGLRSKCLLFNTFKVLEFHLSIRQILLVLHLSKRLYVGSLRGALDMILQSETLWNDGSLGEMFLFFGRSLDRALQRCLKSQLSKLGNRDVMSKFAGRIEYSTVWFY